MYEYRAVVVRVIDGDTIVLDVDLGHRIHHTGSYRLNGIDAPEIRGKTREQGLLAKQHLEDLLAKYGLEKIETVKDKEDKYGRYLVNLIAHLPGTFHSLNYQMVLDGFAKPMAGKVA